MPSWFIPDANGQSFGGINASVVGYGRGWLDIAQTNNATSTDIKTRMTADWMKSYSRWVRGTVYVNGVQVAQYVERVQTATADWANVADTGTVVTNISRTTSDRSIAVRAVFEVGTPYQNPDWSWAAETTQYVIVPARIDAPSAPTGVTNTRVSDTRNDLSWTRNATTYGIYSSQIIRRSVDGGAFSNLATIAGTATSYSDTTTQANHKYAYQVVATNSAGSATSAASGTIYNTPAKPTGITASRVDATNVQIAFTNNALTETQIDVRRSTTGAAPWTNLASVVGSGLTRITDNPGGGTFYYQLRASRTSPLALSSDWSDASNAVITITPPAAPSLVSPASGTVISRASGNIRFQWVHNSLDGSAQTAARVWFSTNGGSTFTMNVSVADTQYADISAANWPVNTTVVWRVETKGADANYSPVSASRSFIVQQVPQGVIVSPASDGIEVTALPLAIEWSYSDQSGTQQSASLTLLSDTGQVLWQRTIQGAATSYSLDAAEFLPANNQTYTLRLAVASTSTLSNTTERTFTTAYVTPAPPIINLTTDLNAGAVQAMLVAGTQAGTPATVSMGLFRRLPDGTTTAIVTGVQSGAVVTDRFCPTETDVTYIVAAFAATGVASQTEAVTHIFGSGAAYINYGDGYRSVARIGLAPTTEYGSEPQAVVIPVWGTRLPLVRTAPGLRTTGSLSGKVWKSGDVWPDGTVNATLNDIDILDATGGLAVVRLPRRRAFLASIKVRSTTGDDRQLAEVSLVYEMVEPGELAI